MNHTAPTGSCSSIDGGRVQAILTENVICRYYAHGCCRKGDNCTYVHARKEMASSFDDTAVAGGRLDEVKRFSTRNVDFYYAEEDDWSEIHSNSVFVELREGLVDCFALLQLLAGDDGERRHALSMVVGGVRTLSRHEFGNYAVRCALYLRDREAMRAIFDRLRCHFVDLSMNMYASSVVYEMMECAPEYLRELIVLELIYDDRLPEVLVHEYGSLVVQGAVDMSKGLLLAEITSAINCYSDMLVNDEHVLGHPQNIVLGEMFENGFPIAGELALFDDDGLWFSGEVC